MGGQKGRSRGEKELERLTNDLVVRAFFNRFKTILLPYLEKENIKDQIKFRNRIDSLIERGWSTIGKDWKVIEEEPLLKKGIKNLRTIIQKGNKNPHKGIEIIVLEKLLFGNSPMENFSGISYEFQDNDERGENFYERVCIYVEPGATTTDLRKFVDQHGKSVTNRLRDCLPETNPLRGKMGSQNHSRKNKLVYDLKMGGMRFKEIPNALKKEGFDVSIDNVKKIFKRYKGT